MDTAIITGLISAGAAIAVCLINNHYIQAESDKKHEANIMLISYRLEQLEAKVTMHNNLVERTFKVEQEQKLLSEQLKATNDKIEELRRGDDGR